MKENNHTEPEERNLKTLYNKKDIKKLDKKFSKILKNRKEKNSSFNLSEKIDDREPERLLVRDVKEFIKRNVGCGTLIYAEGDAPINCPDVHCGNNNSFCYRCNKLLKEAGKELSK